MRVQYTCISNRGLVRRSNQDNLVWEKQYLPLVNDGLSEPVSSDIPLTGGLLFGVFDGIGGEPRGDAAAYIAAKTAAGTVPASADELEELCRSINGKICDYARRNELSSCGTTAAFLLLDGKQAIGCNLGDSRIYLFRDHTLTQLSEDHVLPVYNNSKPPLLQCLGIPETEMTLEPSLFEKDLRRDDLYIICSDGLTDMLTDDRILDILQEESPVRAQAESLLAGALASGGRDNVSFILLKYAGSNIETA